MYLSTFYFLFSVGIICTVHWCIFCNYNFIASSYSIIVVPIENWTWNMRFWLAKIDLLTRSIEGKSRSIIILFLQIGNHDLFYSIYINVQYYWYYYSKIELKLLIPLIRCYYKHDCVSKKKKQIDPNWLARTKQKRKYQSFKLSSFMCNIVY